ncbi:MAG: C4-type zinc ribbon domain-containing protein [Candidatus Omnitrophica bacterium]|nr:C4-type zinc ribbon domain-containing protein [Candidatus Omnitrophota bacterium]
MPDLKSQISSLIKLQKIDTEIYALKSEKEAKPAQIQGLDAAFDEKKQSLAVLDKEILDLQKLKKDKELELASKEEGAKKLQSQLYQLKTNKEYQAMLQQINDTKADASVIEDKILELMDQIDSLKTGVDKEKLVLQQEEKALGVEKGKIQDRVKEIDDRLSQLEAQKKQVIPEIDTKILPQYERILKSRDGLAIVQVKDNSCGGCNMHVPPQVINLIRMYERIITCEVCNRMLYIGEDEAV